MTLGILRGWKKPCFNYARGVIFRVVSLGDIWFANVVPYLAFYKGGQTAVITFGRSDLIPDVRTFGRYEPFGLSNDQPSSYCSKARIIAGRLVLFGRVFVAYKYLLLASNAFTKTFLPVMSTTQIVTTAESNEPVLKLSPGNHYAFSHLLPTFPLGEHYPPLEPFEYNDAGHRALLHEDPLGYLKSAHSVSEITPGLGTEVRGIKLGQLDPGAMDELALHVAQRGLVVFRDQDDFINGPTEKYLEWGRHFGR